MLMRSTIPLKSASAPIGSWIGTGCAPRRSIIVWTPRSKFGADAVHLVDVGDARDVVLVGLAPHGLGLRLDAGDRVEQRDGAVEHAQRALDLDGEVDVAGRVDDVDPVALPLAGGRRRGDRDAALLLLLHPVHRRGALVDLSHLVGAAGVIEDALGRRGLARVDVGHDPDVPGLLERELARHEKSLVVCGLRSRLPELRAKKRALRARMLLRGGGPEAGGYVSRVSIRKQNRGPSPGVLRGRITPERRLNIAGVRRRPRHLPLGLQPCRDRGSRASCWPCSCSPREA